jgi:hypothetical protein
MEGATVPRTKIAHSQTRKAGMPLLLELGKAQVTGPNGAIAGPFRSEDIDDLK